MKSLSILSVVLTATGVGLASTVFTPAEAASMTFSLNEFTGDDTKVNFFLEDINGGVRVSATIDTSGSNVSGDISGIWFNLVKDALVGSLTITGTDITKTAQKVAGVDDLGGGVNFNGGGSKSNSGGSKSNGGGSSISFDVGVKIGGNGNDNIEQTSFNVLGNNLTIADFAKQTFAVRIKSSDGKEGSSKLLDVAPDGPPNQSRGWQKCNVGDNPIPCR